MVKRYGIRPRANGELPTPGLLLSLGDGTAVEVTECKLHDAIEAMVGIHTSEPIARSVIAALIQQAQEKR